MPRLVFKYPWQDAHELDVYSDTDWGGCKTTRKSTSGGCVLLGRHLLKSWSSTQPSVSLSSGEAEFYGVLKAAGAGLGVQSLLQDVGQKVSLRVWTDSSAAIGICGRQGLGKLRHIETHTLWVQQALRTKRFALHKVAGEANPGDLFTKHLSSRERVGALTKLLGCAFTSGRSELAPTMRQAAGTATTMASKEVFSIYDVTSWNELPHLMAPHERDSHFPAIEPPEVDEEQDFQRESDDSVLQHGLVEGRASMEWASINGRLRKDHSADGTTGTTQRVWWADVEDDTGADPGAA